MNNSLYHDFKNKLNLNDDEFLSLIKSFVITNKKRYSDIMSFTNEDENNVVQEVCVELLSNNRFSEKVTNDQVYSYVNKVVKHRVSIYITGIISPIKMVNPKGGESKEKGTALGNASHFRRNAYEIDDSANATDKMEDLAVPEDCLNDDLLHDYNFNLNSLLKPLVEKAMEISRNRGYEDMMRIEGKHDDPVKGDTYASSHYNKIISEKINSIGGEGRRAYINTRFLQSHFPEVLEVIYEKTNVL